MAGPNSTSTTLKQIGVGSGAALAVFYMVFQLLIQVGVVQSALAPVATPASYEKVSGQVDALYEWHNRRDADGVLLWYVPRSMTVAIGEQTAVLRDLGEAIRHQTSVLERMDRRDERRDERRQASG